MSVKKMGSKLAQGVRQVKAQQAKASANTEQAGTPSVAKAVKPAASAVKPASKTATKPEASSNKSSGVLHPDRVWPD